MSQFLTHVCPVCGKLPKLDKAMEDRDLFPSLPKVRFKCSGMDGHIVASPWIYSKYLNSTHESLEMLAVDEWNLNF